MSLLFEDDADREREREVALNTEELALQAKRAANSLVRIEELRSQIVSVLSGMRRWR